MDCGLWTVDCGLWTLDSGQWTVATETSELINLSLMAKTCNNPIIVKFVSHKTKALLYKARTKLKNVKVSDLFPSYCSPNQRQDPIYINENLTRFRRNLVNEASKLKRTRGGPILKLWTIDGKIFIKTSPDGAPVRIYSANDLNEL